MEEITLYGITLTVVTILLIIVVLYAIRAVKNKGYKKKLEYLDIEKNKILGTPIVPELAKIENYKNNDKINIMYKEWKGRLDDINEFQIPRITDMLLEADYTLSQMDYKSTLYKIAKLEMEIYKVRTNAEFLLDEIRDLTTSEERNRMTITKLKTRYRELFERFNSTKGDYGVIAESISLQFENIAKKFEDFEKVIENSQIQELNQINSSIEEMLDHMTVIIEEMPSIVLLSVGVIPKKIEEIKRYYDAMTKAGYPLDYLNVEYNIDEANAKLKDIMTRAKHLNIEESLLILKVLNEYFEGLINDFEKEKNSRKTYEETLRSFDRKLTGINKLVSDIFKQLKYDIHIDILNSLDYGIPQNRKRLFVVGFKKANKKFKFPKKLDLNGITMFDFLEEKVAVNHYLGKKGFEFVTNPKYSGRARINQNIIRTQKANQQFNWNGDFVFEKYDSNKHDLEIMKRAYLGEWNGEKGVIRQLSYRECYRLMGFSDSFDFEQVNNVWRYRHAGNSIVVNVLENIFIEIIKVETFDD